VDQLDLPMDDGKLHPFVLVAEPRFLGMLRAALPPRATSALVATIAKDLMHQSEQMVRDYLPAEVFKAVSGGRAQQR
jgi:protein required for attachment to host cells